MVPHCLTKCQYYRRHNLHSQLQSLIPTIIIACIFSLASTFSLMCGFLPTHLTDKSGYYLYVFIYAYLDVEGIALFVIATLTSAYPYSTITLPSCILSRSTYAWTQIVICMLSIRVFKHRSATWTSRCVDMPMICTNTYTPIMHRIPSVI